MNAFSWRHSVLNKKYLSKGFTLIELLVVIAIIGGLASIILASLSSAKNKSIDARTKGNLSNLRSQAELYHTVSGSYRGDVNAIAATSSALVCQTDGTVFNTTDGIGGKITMISDQYDPETWSATCALGDNPDSWAVSMPLKAGGEWCVNYQGIAKEGAASGGGSGAEATCI